jgi:hypothetical protein
MSGALFFTIARVLIAGLLFWAAAGHLSYNTRWVFQLPIFAAVAWGFYRAINEDEPELLFIYGAIGFMFIPFSAFAFSKNTWKVLDISVGILTLLSIFLLDSAPFEELMKRPGAKIIRKLILMVFACAWVVLGCAIIYSSTLRISNIVRLKLDRKETQAHITRVTHTVYHTTDVDNNPESYDVYKTEYTFQTEDGQAIAGSAELLDNTVTSLISDDLLEQYSRFEVDKDQVVPLPIEYQAARPTNNRAVNHREGFFGTLLGGILLALFSLVPIVWGVSSAKGEVQELLPERKKQKPTMKKSS